MMVALVARLIGAVALLVQLFALAAIALLIQGAVAPGRARLGPEATGIPWAIPLAVALGIACLAAAWSRTGARVGALLATIAIGIGFAGVPSPDVGSALAAIGAVSIGAWAVEGLAASVGADGAAELRGRSRRLVAGLAFFVALTGFVGISLQLTSAPGPVA